MATSGTPIAWDSYSNIIDGKHRGGKEHYNGINPSTGEPLWDVPISTTEDVDDAVRSAKRAFEKWSQVEYETRAALLRKYGDLLLSQEEKMTEVLGSEAGKAKPLAQAETKGGTAAFFDHFLSLKMPYDREQDGDKYLTTRYTPLGVIGAICPWNFPLFLALGKIIPALLTGNTIIVKPSPYTPYATIKAVELAQQIFEPGVVQVVCGGFDDKLGPMLTSHPDIAKISFTGSSATGKKIMAACAKTLKRITLELGGNDASIVLPDVDIDKVAQELVTGAFVHSGQVCVATKRIYIHQDIYDKILPKMVEYAKSLPMSPIQNNMQYEKVKDFFKDSGDKGYKFALGSPEIASTGKGYHVNAAIIDNPPSDSRIVTEEPFGPIVPTIRWSDEEDVIRRANADTTGLGACVWSKDLDHAERIGKRLQAGSVFVNSWERLTPKAFFGGHKESGIGGEWGKEGLKAFCNAQVMHSYKL